MPLDLYYQGELDLDFSVLERISPYKDDIKEKLGDIDLDEEIKKINAEMSKINIQTIPMDKYDYMVVFITAVCEIFADFMVCDPNQPGSIADKFNHSDNPLGQWCNNIHENLDHSGNPLDFQGRFDSDGNLIPNGIKHTGDTISFGGGDHRSRTYGHDLLRFWDAIKMYHDGAFVDAGYINVNGSSKLVEVISTVNQNGNPYAPMTYFEAILAYSTHMFADFFSSKGLPVPGWSFLSHASDREVRQMAANAYKNGFNLRTLLLQGIPVAIAEIVIRLYVYIRYGHNYDESAVEYKKNILLLLTHGAATAVNIGKVILTKNPFAINIFMIFRTCHLVWKVVKGNLSITNRAIEKVNLSVLSLQMQTAKTMILLDESIYYTFQIRRLVADLKAEFDAGYANRMRNMENDMDEMQSMLARLRELNS